jgi:hypothetical protein
VRCLLKEAPGGCDASWPRVRISFGDVVALALARCSIYTYRSVFLSRNVPAASLEALCGPGGARRGFEGVGGGVKARRRCAWWSHGVAKASGWRRSTWSYGSVRTLASVWVQCNVVSCHAARGVFVGFERTYVGATTAGKAVVVARARRKVCDVVHGGTEKPGAVFGRAAESVSRRRGGARVGHFSTQKSRRRSEKVESPNPASF